MISRIWRQVSGLSHAAKAGLTVVLTILLVVVALTGGYFLVIRAENSATAAQVIATAVQRNQRDICVASNKENAKQILLWQYILRLAPPKTPQQRQQDRQFEVFLDEVFSPVICVISPLGG